MFMSDRQIIESLVDHFIRRGDYDRLEDYEKEVEDFRNSVTFDYFYDVRSGTFVYNGVKYIWIESEESAFELTKNYVADKLCEEIESGELEYHADYIFPYLTISDTDKRILAYDLAENDVDSMTDEEILERAGMKEEYERASDDKKGEVLDEAKIVVMDEFYEKHMEKLSEDPIGYLIDDLGLYDEESIVKAPFVEIDYDDYAFSIVKYDGWTTHLSQLWEDAENYETTRDGVVYFKE